MVTNKIDFDPEEIRRKSQDYLLKKAGYLQKKIQEIEKIILENQTVKC